MTGPAGRQDAIRGLAGLNGRARYGWCAHAAMGAEACYRATGLRSRVQTPASPHSQQPMTCSVTKASPLILAAHAYMRISQQVNAFALLAHHRNLSHAFGKPKSCDAPTATFRQPTHTCSHLFFPHTCCPRCSHIPHSHPALQSSPRTHLLTHLHLQLTHNHIAHTHTHAYTQPTPAAAWPASTAPTSASARHAKSNR